MSAEPIQQNGEFYPDSIDPMMDALRASIVGAGIAGTALAELGEGSVIVVDPSESQQSIDKKVNTMIAKNKGLALLLVSGSATNPAKESPGPRINLQIEMQLYVNQASRGKKAISPLQFVCEIAKHYHLAEIRIAGFPWYERVFFIGFDPLDDPEFTAFVVNFEREFQL